MTTRPPEAPGAPSGDGSEQPQEPQPHPHPGPRASREEMKDLGRLRRSAADRKVAGVAGGLARHLDIDPLVLRVAFVVLTFFGGAGLIVYVACWLLVPDEETQHAPVTLDERSRTVALLVVGVLAALALIGDSWGYFWFPWPLVIIALVVFLLLNRHDRPTPAPAPQSAEPPVGPAPAAAGTGAPPTYAHQAPTQGYGHGYGYSAPTYVAPRESRRRGPTLFWFTLALIALGIGLLGTADVAGVPVADAAYPALAVALIGAMLVVGAFFGRAGGLILLGLVATLAMVVTTSAASWDSGETRETPATAFEVQPRYEFGAGELLLDLTDIDDLEALDDRTIRLQAGLGRIEVVVPDGLDVAIDARVGGPGSIELFGATSEGIDISRETTYTSGEDAPELTVVIDVGFGEVVVDTEG